MPREPRRRKQPTAHPACAPRVRSVHSKAQCCAARTRAATRRRSPARPTSTSGSATTTATILSPRRRRIRALARRDATRDGNRTALFATRTARAVRIFRRAFGLRHERLHRQAQTSTLVAIDELHAHAVALLDDVLRLVRAPVRELGDVHQPFRARQDLDERAERGRALDRALVFRTDLGLDRERLDHLARALHRLTADRSDRDETRVVHGELRARLVLNAANRLALRS